MSLINEALKKAQRQRMEAPAATTAILPEGAAGVGAAPRIAKRHQPLPARTVVLMVIGGLCLFGMAGVLAFLYWFSDVAAPAPVAPVKHSAPTPAPASPIAPSIVLPPSLTSAGKPAPEPGNAVSPIDPPASPILPLPANVAPPFDPTPAPPPVSPIAPSAPTPPATASPISPVKPPVPAVPAKPVANPKVYEFLDKLRITGIRVSPTDPKVLMNDRVFRLNDVVDRATGLQLIRVEAGTLVFKDEAGFEYTKPF